MTAEIRISYGTLNFNTIRKRLHEVCVDGKMILKWSLSK